MQASAVSLSNGRQGNLYETAFVERAFSSVY